MELKGERFLALPREQVWEALNDPAVLRQCVPGCDTFESVGEHEYKIVMTAAVGPVKARFTGMLTLSDIQPPTSYQLAFNGSGGAAGFGKGGAQVVLAPVEGGTTLTYTVNAQVGGRLAQVGARLIDGVAKKMADEFFVRFARVMGADAAAPVAPAADIPAQPPAQEQIRSEAAAPSHTAAPASRQASAPTAAATPPSLATPAAADSRPAATAARWVWPAIVVVIAIAIYFMMSR